MNIQNKTMFHYVNMTKARCGMVFPIMVMAVCITLIFYSSFSPDAQIKVLEMALNSVPVPEIVQNKVPDNNNNNNIQIQAPIKSDEKKVTVKNPVYFFGDSLYDTGMAFFNGLGPLADTYPYGKTFFKRPAGRFSDGLLIPDFIAQFANLPLPQPYANPYLVDYTNSVNFAGTAAGVLVDGRNYSLNLKLQTDYFVEMVGKMKKQYGKEKAKKLVSKAVLVFNIGSNDYVDIWIQNPKPLNSSFVNSFNNKIFGNFTTSITRMYNEGARKFAFQNYGPMGCLPLYLQDDGRCAEGLNDLAKLHNVGFGALAKSWARRLPGLKYIIYDFYTSLTSHVRHGAKYGFKETQTACCGSGKFNAKFTCMEKSNFTLCDDISSHLFFDPAHPTQKADMQFAQEFWDGPSSLVTPCNIKTLLFQD